MRRRLADVAFLASQVLIAWLTAQLWTIEDTHGLLRHYYPWALAVSQLVGMTAGVWQGRAGTDGRVRLVLCGLCPLALTAWWVLMADGPLPLRPLVLLPAMAGTAGFLGPSVGAVFVGVHSRRGRPRFAPAG